MKDRNLSDHGSHTGTGAAPRRLRTRTPWCFLGLGHGVNLFRVGSEQFLRKYQTETPIGTRYRRDSINDFHGW